MSPKEREAPSIENNALSVEPIEIFPGQQEVQAQMFKKTPLMLKVEKEIQGDLQEFLPKSYLEGLSSVDISKMIRAMSNGNIQISNMTIIYWLNKLNIPIRSRIERAKLVWQNPEKRERRISQIHNPVSDSKRRESAMKHWQDLSESEKNNKLRNILQARTMSAQSFMKEKLGEDPAERLYDMHWNRGLTKREIREELGISLETLRSWMKNLGIETRKSSRGRAKYGYIRINKEGYPNLVEQARRQGFLRLINEIFRNA